MTVQLLRLVVISFATSKTEALVEVTITSALIISCFAPHLQQVARFQDLTDAFSGDGAQQVAAFVCQGQMTDFCR